MTNRINYYTDSNRIYIMECLERVPYFQTLAQEDKNAMAFNFELKTFKKGALIQSPGSVPSSMMILVKGIVEIFATFGGSQEMKIEYLRQGDVINHTLFLYQQPAFLPIRCMVNCEVLLLSIERIEMLKNTRPESSLTKEIDRMLQHGRDVGFDKLYLDYIKKPRVIV